NIAAMKEQFRSWGVLYDWTKEVTTCEPEYYRWNQWFFLRLLEKGLAVRKKSAVNWCPSCLTVLANEQAEGGVCERCKTPVVQRELALVPRLLEGNPKKAERQAWVTSVRSQERIAREAEGAEKDGRDTGRKAINPFTGQEIPVWLANFVIADYGTGALMAVPAHDTRDYEFATKYGIPIVKVIEKEEKTGNLLGKKEGTGDFLRREEGEGGGAVSECYTGEGRLAG